MVRTFIQTWEFIRKWQRMGLDDDDLRRLELLIMNDPKAGPVIRGTGKLRKLRFASEGKGKRGGIRVCYVDLSAAETVYLITAYDKTEKDDLTQEECAAIRKMITVLEQPTKGKPL